jgi:hypothetical protein
MLHGLGRDPDTEESRSKGAVSSQQHGGALLGATGLASRVARGTRAERSGHTPYVIRTPPETFRTYVLLRCQDDHPL